jgi:hypothetical protein
MARLRIPCLEALGVTVLDPRAYRERGAPLR